MAGEKAQAPRVPGHALRDLEWLAQLLSEKAPIAIRHWTLAWFNKLDEEHAEAVYHTCHADIVITFAKDKTPLNELPFSDAVECSRSNENDCWLVTSISIYNTRNGQQIAGWRPEVGWY